MGALGGVFCGAGVAFGLGSGVGDGDSVVRIGDSGGVGMDGEIGEEG